MAMEPSLWGTLPRELLPLVFAHLPLAGIGRLRVLSKEWKRNVDSKDSDLNKFIAATTDLRKFVLVSWHSNHQGVFHFFHLEAESWHALEADAADFPSGYMPIAADGGLFCCIRTPGPTEPRHSQVIVVNPLTRKFRVLPRLLRQSDVRLRTVQLTMNRETEVYKLHILSDLNGGLFAQVYDSHNHIWCKSRTGKIIGWEKFELRNFVAWEYNCASKVTNELVSSCDTGNNRRTLNCLALGNRSVFVLHKMPSRGYMHGGEQNSIFYRISEYQFSDRANEWVKLGEHDCDPSISSPRELAVGELPETMTLLACNGFLLVRNRLSYLKSIRLWLYNLSTLTWSNLPDLDLHYSRLMMCEANWSAIP